MQHRHEQLGVGGRVFHGANHLEALVLRVYAHHGGGGVGAEAGFVEAFALPLDAATAQLRGSQFNEAPH